MLFPDSRTLPLRFHRLDLRPQLASPRLPYISFIQSQHVSQDDNTWRGITSASAKSVQRWTFSSVNTVLFFFCTVTVNTAFVVEQKKRSLRPSLHPQTSCSVLGRSLFTLRSGLERESICLPHCNQLSQGTNTRSGPFLCMQKRSQ